MLTQLIKLNVENATLRGQCKDKQNGEYETDFTAGKVSKYVVISGPYFPVFGMNTGKYGPEITTYLDTFHAVPITKTAVLRVTILFFR